METYKTILDKNSWILLSIKGDYFKYITEFFAKEERK